MVRSASSESLLAIILEHTHVHAHTLYKTISYQAISFQDTINIKRTDGESKSPGFLKKQRPLSKTSVLCNPIDGQFKSRLTGQIIIKSVEKKLSSEYQCCN
jgi:hypothetical protein